MHITIPRDTLVTLASRAASVADKSGTNPVLGAVLLSARGLTITATATDKALTINAGYPVTEVLDPGEALVNAAELDKIAKVLPAGPVIVRSAENLRVEILAGRSTFKLNGFAPADFPVPPAVDKGRSMQVAAVDMRRMIDVVLADVAAEDNRYGLNGVPIESVGNGKVRMIATDGNRLAYAEAPHTGEIGLSKKQLIPRGGLVQLRRLLEGYEGDVQLDIGERSAQGTFGDVRLYMRLLEADFPDYRQVLPSTFKRKVRLNRDALVVSVKRALVLATDGAKSIRFAFGLDGLVLSSRKLDVGDGRDEVACELTGEPMTMGFNGRFLLDALLSMRGGEVVIDLGDPLSPAKLTDPNDDASMWIIMPVRID